MFFQVNAVLLKIYLPHPCQINLLLILVSYYRAIKIFSSIF